MTKSTRLSLKANFSWNFIGSLVYSLCQWLILVMLAKVGDAEVVGLYTLGFALTAPILMLTNLQLRQVQATDTTNEFNFNDYFGLRIVSGFVAVFITIIVIVLNNYSTYKACIILLVALTKIIDSYSDVIYGQLQQKERMDYIGISRIIKGILTLLVISTTLLVSNNLVYSLVALCISSFLIFVLYDKRVIKKFISNVKPNFIWNKHKNLILLTLPLGIMLMLGSLNTNIPRILVERFLGEEQLGYFAGIAYLMVAGNMFISAVGQAGAPRLAKLYKNNEYKKYCNLLLKLVSIGFFIGITGFLISTVFGQLILQIVYSKSYADYHNIFVLIMLAAIFNYASSFLGYGLTSMRLFKIQPYLGSIWVIVSIITSVIFIPKWGLVGASIALIVSSVIQFSTSLLVVVLNIKMKSKRRADLLSKSFEG